MADEKISELTADSSPASTDETITNDDTVGSPVTKRSTWANIFASLQSSITGLGTVTSGDVSAILDAASTTVVGVAEIATAAETTTGTDATRTVSPDGLAGSGYGKRTIAVLVSDSTVKATGDGAAYFPRIPSYLNGWNIIEVAACRVAGTGLLTIQLYNVTQAADILSTELTIDANETDSKDAATPASINTSEDDLTTGDRIRIDLDGDAGSDTTWLGVQMTVQLP